LERETPNPKKYEIRSSPARSRLELQGNSTEPKSQLRGNQVTFRLVWRLDEGPTHQFPSLKDIQRNGERERTKEAGSSST
jgi:hypothetical protein